MGISQKIDQWSNQVQQGVKSSSYSLFTWSIKIVTALLLSLTIALIAQELVGFGSLVFTFLIILQSALIIKIIMGWSLASTLIFDLICILTALLLRMYILIAP
jgi:hypothetical protein